MDRLIIGFIFWIDHQSRIDVKGLGIYDNPCDELINSIKDFIKNYPKLNLIKISKIIGSIDDNKDLILSKLFDNDDIYRFDLSRLNPRMVDLLSNDVEIYSIPLDRIKEFEYINQ